LEVESDHCFLANGIYVHNSEPNLQNIPKDNTIRNLFIPRKGYKFLEADYKAAEIRGLAYASGDKKLLDRCAPGVDIHSETAADIYGVSVKTIMDKKASGFCPERDVAKTTIFGVIYGEGAGSLAARLNISKAEAQLFINKLLGTYGNVGKFIRKIKNKAKRGEDIVSPLGRRRRLLAPMYDRDEYGGKYSAIMRQAVNSPIQGLASDLTVRAIIKIYNKLIEWGVDARIVLTVHDSILIEMHDDEETIKKVNNIIDTCMVYSFPKSRLVFLVDKNEGYCWSK